MNFAGATLIDTKTGETLAMVDSIQECNIDIDKTKKHIEWKPFRSVTIEIKDAHIDINVLKSALNQKEGFKITLTNSKLNRLKYLYKRTKNRRIKKKLYRRISRLNHPIFNKVAFVSRPNIYRKDNRLEFTNVRY